ncbi:MAG: hypothetical protein KC931_15185 [Candidatus Omnitrophica bacterium]|nr:hypothetical protein [Candidatus Omnitrophota bacterium]MCA9414636.1 hypothetical protein [Candidatus Omnitrophota bacterium]MCA9437141.1 hypothetical protein [Candidatus Omnitrophota bacterium]MCA9440835.1 hypothetical protein [Candidatus Omnitrophota bacterium]MCA9448464.1 hypothetical protein [Candidatus Omnitrophota bacterium]
MSPQERDSIRLLKQVIRKKRVHMGLPAEGSLNVEAVVEAMKEQPPMDELVSYIKSAIKEDLPVKTESPTAPPVRRPFDRRA